VNPLKRHQDSFANQYQPKELKPNTEFL